MKHSSQVCKFLLLTCLATGFLVTSAQAGTTTISTSTGAPTYGPNKNEVVIGPEGSVLLNTQCTNGTISVTYTTSPGVSIMEDQGSGTTGEAASFSFDPNCAGQINTITLNVTHNSTNSKGNPITCVGGADSVTFYIYIPKIELNKLTFGDGIQMNHANSYSDTGTAIQQQDQWQKDASSQQPICYIKGSRPTPTAEFKITPDLGSRGITVAIRATGTQTSSGTTLSYVDQPVWLTGNTVTVWLPQPSGALDAKVDNTTFTLDTQVTYDWNTYSDITQKSSNQLFVVYAQPSDHAPTDKRLNWATTQAENGQRIGPIASSFAIKLSSNPGYQPPRASTPDAWGFLDSGQSGDCITLANLAATGLGEIGIPSQSAHSYPTLDGSPGYPAVNQGSCRVQSYTTQMYYNGQAFNAVLVYIDSSGQTEVFEGFFTVVDEADNIQAYTVYPYGGPFMNQNYYFLEILRSVATTQLWVWDGTQSKGGITVMDMAPVPGKAQLPVPNEP